MPEPVEIELQQAPQTLRQMLEDGTEYRKLLNVMLVYATQSLGVGFVENQNGFRVKNIRRTDVDNLSLYFRSGHELLQWIFDQQPVPEPPKPGANASANGGR